MTNADDAQAKFQPAMGMLGAIVGLLAGYFYAMEWPDAIVGGGVGFVVGGAVSLLRGIWQYLLVFLVATGGFIWLLVHYVK